MSAIPFAIPSIDLDGAYEAEYSLEAVAVEVDPLTGDYISSIFVGGTGFDAFYDIAFSEGIKISGVSVSSDLGVANANTKGLILNTETYFF